METNDRMKNLVDYFTHVRVRPGMYLGINTITKLYDQIQGYGTAFWFNDIDNPIDKNFFDNFNEFVHKYYEVNNNDNWKGVILEQCWGNEQKALNKFFEIFNLFISNEKPINSKATALSLFDKIVFEQETMKNKLGSNFLSILSEITDLIKYHAMTNIKYDYDTIIDQLNQRADERPELKSVLTELSFWPDNNQQE